MQNTRDHQSHKLETRKYRHVHNPYKQRYLVSCPGNIPLLLFTYMDREREAVYVETVTTPGPCIQLPLISRVTINKEPFSAD